jgi:NAD(P)-dependent dehydrogenase (short-subunit alcohol dehydrogenase family)
VGADETVDMIQKEGGTAYAGQCDVSEDASVQVMVAESMEKLGRIDILVNNAGIELHKAIEDVSFEEWDRVMAVNVRGMFLCCKHALPHMKKAGKGKIINMGSNGGYIAAPFQTAYCASKGAVHQFTKALALECSPAGIRVNAIAPGGVDTPMLDYLEASNKEKGIDDLKARVCEVQMGEIIKPEDVADLALFLASDESRMIHGTALLIDGGYTAM